MSGEELAASFLTLGNDSASSRNNAVVDTVANAAADVEIVPGPPQPAAQVTLTHWSSAPPRTTLYRLAPVQGRQCPHPYKWVDSDDDSAFDIL